MGAVADMLLTVGTNATEEVTIVVVHVDVGTYASDFTRVRVLPDAIASRVIALIVVLGNPAIPAIKD